MPTIETLSDSAAQVLHLLISGNLLSRPELTACLGVTAPTVNTALLELVDAGLVTQTGSRQGKLGRSATLFGLDVSAGWLLGIDLGSTQILIVARSLDGTLLGDFRYSALETSSLGRSSPSLTEVAAEHVAEFLDRFSASHGRLRAVGIALAHVVPISTSTDSIIGLGKEAVRLGKILEDLRLPVDVPVLLENNVNCAALAEMSLGAAQSADNFVYLQIGVRIGAGIVVDGKLRRGAYGGSGELSLLPFPFVPQSTTNKHSFQLEKHLGSEHFLERTRSNWSASLDPAPTTPKELIDMANKGSEPSLKAVEQHAIDVARLAMLLVAVIDPELIVLGGGVGRNPFLAQMIEKVLHKEYPKIKLDVGALGDRATVEGATALATEYARKDILGHHYTSRLGGQGSVLPSGTVSNS